MSDIKRTYLMSYPRSGNTWIRYIVEYFTKVKSCGHTKCDVDNNISEKVSGLNGIDHDRKPFLFKRHWFERNDTPDYDEDNLIVVVRNYKECIVRHSGRKSFEDFCGIITGRHDFGDYMQYLKLYEKWRGSKMVVYYEDLITDPKKEIERILSFFGLDLDGVQDFMDNFDFHKKESLRYYSDNIAKSATMGNTLKFHSNVYSPSEIALRDNFVKEKFPELYDKYLKRYEGV